MTALSTKITTQMINGGSVFFVGIYTLNRVLFWCRKQRPHSTGANDQGNALLVPEVLIGWWQSPSLSDQKLSLVDQVCAVLGKFLRNWSDTKLWLKYWQINVNPVSTCALHSTVQDFGKSLSCANSFQSGQRAKWFSWSTSQVIKQSQRPPLPSGALQNYGEG